MLQGRVTRFSPPGSSSSAGAGVLSPDPRPELGDATRALSRDESPARRDFDGRERAKRLGDWPGVTATKRSSSNAAAPKRRGLPVSLRPLNAGWSYPSPFELVSDEPPAATVQDRRAPHARYFILELAESLAESPLTPTLFRQILGRIERLAGHPT